MMEKCDFCGGNENVGVYATDYAPVSLCYCSNCLNYPNIRPREIAIYGWGRLGDLYFTPYIDEGLEYPPMVYSEGKYITVKELIENLTEEQINNWVRWDVRKDVILERFKDELERIKR